MCLKVQNDKKQISHKSAQGGEIADKNLILRGKDLLNLIEGGMQMKTTITIIIIWLGNHLDISSDSWSIIFLYHSIYSLAAHCQAANALATRHLVSLH